MCLKYCWMSGSVDPDQMQHSAASDLNLHCSLRPVPLLRVIMVICIFLRAVGNGWHYDSGNH